MYKILQNKKLIITLVASIAVVMICIVIAIVTSQKPDKERPTGGAGKPAKGTIIIQNESEPSNDEHKISLGNFVTLSQTEQIKTLIAIDIKYNQKKDVSDSITTEVIKDSVKIDYTKNLVEYKIRVPSLSLIYNVKIDTLSSLTTITDKDGKSIAMPALD